MARIGTLFQQYRILEFELDYEPMCGTTTNGAITIGVYAQGGEAKELNESLALTMQPNVTGPLFQRSRLALPKRYTTEKRWYDVGIHEAPALLLVWVNCDATSTEKTYGRIWCRYRLEFQGIGEPE